MPCHTAGATWTEVVITFDAPQFIFASGKNIKTFNRGDSVNGKAMIKLDYIYCIKAFSTIVPSYEYSIDLSGIKVKVPQTGQRTQIIKFNNSRSLRH